MTWEKTRIYISPKISKKNPKKFLNELSNFVEIEISKSKKNSDIIVISEKELKNQVRAIKEEKEERKAFIILCDNIKKILKFDTLLDELGSGNLVDVIPEKGWEKILPLLILKLLKLKDKQKKEGRSFFISEIKNKIENIQKNLFHIRFSSNNQF
jgi:hypothetical protein